MNLEKIKLLAEQERQMDNGQQPYVMLNSNRIAVQPETMEALGLKQGQTISNTIFSELLKHDLEICRKAIKARSTSGHP